MIRAQDVIPQAAAIPVRAGRICLVTSRTGKRWVVPKGCLEPGKTARQIALQEAWEEAGLLGHLEQEALGFYVYEKSGKRYHVTVFLMHVSEVAADWPEGTERRRRWLPPARARIQVDRFGLRKLLRAAMESRALLPSAGNGFKDGSGAVSGLVPVGV